jgi:hypothetical protein
LWPEDSELVVALLKRVKSHNLWKLLSKLNQNLVLLLCRDPLVLLLYWIVRHLNHLVTPVHQVTLLTTLLGVCIQRKLVSFSHRVFLFFHSWADVWGKALALGLKCF